MWYKFSEPLLFYKNIIYDVFQQSQAVASRTALLSFFCWLEWTVTERNTMKPNSTAENKGYWVKASKRIMQMQMQKMLRAIPSK